MKYTIVSSLTNYGVEQIRPFVESINRSGYKGEKLMLVYNVSDDVIKYLDSNGWIIVKSDEQQHIILQRFRDMYALLSQYETDVIIWVDVKDIIFQKDPTEWLDKWIRQGSLNDKKNSDLLEKLSDYLTKLRKKRYMINTIHVFSHKKAPTDKNSDEYFKWQGNDIVDKRASKMLE